MQNTLFGPGIYLTTSLNMALMYSRPGAAWPRCLRLIGRRFSAALLCRVRRDPASVKVESDLLRESEGGRIPERYVVVQNNEMVREAFLLLFCNARPPAAREDGEEDLVEAARRRRRRPSGESAVDAEELAARMEGVQIRRMKRGMGPVLRLERPRLERFPFAAFPTCFVCPRFICRNPLLIILLCYGLLLAGIGCYSSSGFWRFLRRRGVLEYFGRGGENQ